MLARSQVYWVNTQFVRVDGGAKICVDSNAEIYVCAR
jgi:hypothetical protein